MFRYIYLPRLVAYYLREFSYKPKTKNWAVTDLYYFVLSLCMPFISQTFRKARLYALMIAECTNSADQIFKVMKRITGADITDNTSFNSEFMVAYDVDTTTMLPYAWAAAETPTPNIPYETAANTTVLNIKLNGASRQYVEAYLSLLIPFYIDYTIIYS